MCWSLSLPDPVDSFPDLDFALIAPAASSALILLSLLSFSVIQQGQILQVKTQCWVNAKPIPNNKQQAGCRYAQNIPTTVSCNAGLHRKWLYDSELLKRGLEICFFNKGFGDLFCFLPTEQKKIFFRGRDSRAAAEITRAGFYRGKPPCHLKSSQSETFG
jgi:hypothetical protein